MSPPSDQKWRRVAGVAAVARAYECTAILQWAVEFVLKDLEVHRLFGPSANTLATIHEATGTMPSLATDITSRWHRRIQEVWCNTITLCRNPASTLNAAQELQDDFIVAHIYFYILTIGDAYITALQDISLEDRRRMLYGVFGLSRRGVSLGAQPNPRSGGDFNSTSNFGTSESPVDKVHESKSCQTHELDSSLKAASQPYSGQDSGDERGSFTARVDSRITNLRHKLVEIFFQEPWPLE